MTCPYEVGTTEVTVICGYSSKIGIITVVEADKLFEIGDIILSDGTKVSGHRRSTPNK